MSDFADFGAQRTLNHICDRTEIGLDRPQSLLLHLHTGDPGEAGTANEVNTALWTNYSSTRINTDGSTSPYMNPATKAGSIWTSDNLQKITIVSNATMATPSTTVNITHVSIRDHNGSVLFKGATIATAVVKEGAPVVIQAGALDITISAV